MRIILFQQQGLTWLMREFLPLVWFNKFAFQPYTTITVEAWIGLIITVATTIIIASSILIAFSIV